MSRIGPFRPREHLVDRLGVARRVAAGEGAQIGPWDADVERVDVVDAHLAVLELVDGRRGGDGELVEPVVPEEDERLLDTEGGQGADRPARPSPGRRRRRCGGSRPAGLASGPRKLKVVGVPSSRRTGAAKRIAGWKRWAKQKPMPTSRTQRPTPSGPRSMTTPSDSSTSTDPHFEDAARPPCFATRAPAAAVTIAAMVDTFTVPAPSPPVPQVSTSGTVEIGEVDVLGEVEHGAHERGQLGCGLALGAQRRRANAAIWASVASPERMTDIACSTGRRAGRRAGAGAR